MESSNTNLGEIRAKRLEWIPTASAGLMEKFDDPDASLFNETVVNLHVAVLDFVIDKIDIDKAYNLDFETLEKIIKAEFHIRIMLVMGPIDLE